jgi:hypothetical protein
MRANVDLILEQRSCQTDRGSARGTILIGNRIAEGIEARELTLAAVGEAAIGISC